MTYAGGKRLRLIKNSFEDMVEKSLTDLGWFDAGRPHRPVTLLREQVEANEEVRPNTIAISTEDLTGEEVELGSLLEETTWEIFIDVYAESEALGLHLAGDIKDVLKGKLTSISRSRPNFAVMDFSVVTPYEMFYCEIENVEMQRVRTWSKDQNRYWWVLFCEVVDSYTNEDDA